MYRIVSIIDDHYIAKTPNGLKKVHDEIKIENL
jgi:hypothetical protein